MGPFRSISAELKSTDCEEGDRQADEFYTITASTACIRPMIWTDSFAFSPHDLGLPIWAMMQLRPPDSRSSRSRSRLTQHAEQADIFHIDEEQSEELLERLHRQLAAECKENLR